MRLRGQLAANRVVDIKQPLVRTEHLVKAEHVTVDAQRLQVGQVMGGVGDGVDEHVRIAAGLDRPGDFGHRVDRADDVRAMGEEHPAGGVAQQREQRLDIEQAGRGVDFPLANGHAFLQRLAPPGAAVGLVVLVGDDDFVARLPVVADGLREHVGVHRRRRADGQFVGVDIERFRPAAVSPVHRLAGGAGRRESRVGLHAQVPVVVFEHRVRLVADAGAAGVGGEHEIGIVGELVEVGAYEIDVELHRWFLEMAGPPGLTRTARNGS